MKPEAVAASRSGGRTVAFSWEQEPGVSKQSSAETKKHTAVAPAPSTEAVSKRTPATAKKAPAPAAVVAPARPPHRLRVPPPPGGPCAPAVSSPGKSDGRRRGRRRGVRPRDDPFLAAYLACTNNGSSSGKGTQQKLLGWAGLGLGLGLGLRGFGLSCKTSSCAAVEECAVRIPELDED